EDGIRDFHVTGVQTCALPIYRSGLRETPSQCRDFCIRVLDHRCDGALFFETRKFKLHIRQRMAADVHHCITLTLARLLRRYCWRVKERSEKHRIKSCPSKYDNVSAGDRVAFPGVRQAHPNLSLRLTRTCEEHVAPTNRQCSRCDIWRDE